ncbi:MAG: nucleoside kinase [Bacilli bacterium]|nr:nucleoside kinase [Bacilli bacterium]
MLTISVKYNDKKYTYPKGISLYEISKSFQDEFQDEIIIAKLDGALTDLSTNVFNNATVDFYDRNSSVGNKVYESGLIFILVKAYKDLFDSNLIINHSIDKGIYVKVTKNITEKDLEKIKEAMDNTINQNLPIDKILVNRKEAIKFYQKLKEQDKVDILKYNTNTNVNLYKLENTYDYFFNNLPIYTGCIKEFKLSLINKNSFVITYPNIYNNKMTYKHHEKLFNAFDEYASWCASLGIRTVCDLNKKVTEGNINDYVFLAEAYQNNNLLKIAENISKNKNVKIVLISGPSSSGKTTTSKKLQLFLKGFGINPKTLSIDDYFVDREKTPKKEDGSYDFESINAIKLDLFNKDLTKLLKGEKVKIPTYNFVLGKGEYIDDATCLEENEILIIEGLHALNNQLTSSIENKYKYKIYLSPLTVLNLDNHNRIKTTEVRLLRRIVRDNRTRGYNAKAVLDAWASVREGEEKNVFPYQDEADVIFNTTLLYELGVLKTYAEPLLYVVDEKDDCYKDAVRLLNLLKNILPIPSDCIPKDSIIREFIGDGYFV